MYREKTPADRRRCGFAALVAVVLAAGLILAGLVLAGRIRTDLNAQAVSSVKAAVTKAAVQCYAVEGSYPASLSYLESAYGLQINHKRFYVAYDVFASNQLPDVQVLVK